MRRAIVILNLLLSTSAFADEPRKIDFTALLIGVTGDVLFQVGDDCTSALIPGKTCKKIDMTLGDACVAALESMTDQDRNEDPKKRFERDLLARKIYKQSAVTLTTEEVSLIKDRVGKVQPPNVVGAAWPMLDPSVVEKK